MKQLLHFNRKLQLLFFLVLPCLVFFPVSIEAQEWYRSNQAGMALERISSRMVALHYEWAISVENAGYAAMPVILHGYHNASYTMEQRLLYERGKLKRRQWIFRDNSGTTRVNASLPSDLESIGKVESGEVPPFIEIFSSNRTLIETHQYLASGIYTTRYHYRNDLLLRSDTFLNNVPLWTDSYRYTRMAMLRGVERKYHEAGRYAEPLQGTSSRPPDASRAAPVAPVVPAGLDLRVTPPIPGFVNPGSPYDSSIMKDVLGSIYSAKAAKVNYEMDSQGKIISETHYDEDDKVLAVITNEWTKDRIAVIRWSAPPDEGRIVFGYSGKDRISQENYKNGKLERKITARGNEEIEEIFINNILILRAVWKDGRKISEERIR